MDPFSQDYPISGTCACNPTLCLIKIANSLVSFRNSTRFMEFIHFIRSFIRGIYKYFLYKVTTRLKPSKGKFIYSISYGTKFLHVPGHIPAKGGTSQNPNREIQLKDEAP